MDNDVGVIEENPLALAAAFDGCGVEAEVLLEAELDFIGDGYDLPVICGAGNEEEIGEAGVGGIEREDADVFAFFAFAGFVSGE